MYRTIVLHRRCVVCISTNKNCRLCYPRKGRPSVSVQISRQESCDCMLRPLLMAGCVEVGHKPISDAPVIVKEIVASKISNTSLAGHNVVERCTQHRRLE